MPLQPITNREGEDKFSLPKDGWIQIAPKGEFPHPTGIIQVLDDPACVAMCNRFAEDAKAPNFPGLLLDFDHFSSDTKAPSTAAGWIEALENRTDGLWAKVRWSTDGKTAVEGGNYRLVSPVWNRTECEQVGEAEAKKFRPQRLDRAALTNDPVLKGMCPVTNRADGTADNADLEKRLADAEKIIAGYKEEIANRGTSAGGHKGHAARHAALASFHAGQAAILRKAGHEDLAKNHEAIAAEHAAKGKESSSAAHLTGELAKLHK